MTRTIIAEDEAVSSRRMIKLLEEHQMDVIETCKSVTELEESIVTHGQPDLYFLDIHLSDGIVFDFLDKVKIDAPVIFTTAYDQYAIKAFKQNSIDYLLKPIDKEELNQAIIKFRKRKESHPPVDFTAFSQLLLDQSRQKTYQSRTLIKVGDRYKPVSINSIKLIYVKSKSVYILTDENRNYPLDQSVETMMNTIDPKKFFRINRSTIVHIDYIDDIIRYSNSRLEVKIKSHKSESLIVARDRVPGFKEWMGMTL